MIELAVLNACARAHALHVARADHRAIAQAVLMRERAFENVGDDLHIVMRVAGKAGAGRHAVVVDDAQGAETHVLWVAVLSEREAVPAIEPAGSRDAALLCPANGNHRSLRPKPMLNA